MINIRKALMIVAVAGSCVGGRVCARSEFGEIFGATALGSAVGSTVGTALGNAISRPSCSTTVVRRPVKEVVVKEVYVSEDTRRLRRLERTESRVRGELEDLRSHKHSIERKIRALESELLDVESAIAERVRTLSELEGKKVILCRPATATVTKGPKFAEVEVH